MGHPATGMVDREGLALLLRNDLEDRPILFWLGADTAGTGTVKFAAFAERESRIGQALIRLGSGKCMKRDFCPRATADVRWNQLERRATAKSVRTLAGSETTVEGGAIKISLLVQKERT